MKLTKQIKILLYGESIWYFGEGMLGPLFAIFSNRIGGDILNIVWAWAIYLIIAGLLCIFIGKYTDIHNNKEKMMVLGYGLNAILTFCYLFVSAPWHLFVLQAGLGIASSMATPAWNALFAQHGDKHHSGLQWGLAGGMSQIITGIAIVVGGLIVYNISFSALFITMGIVQVFATLYQAQILLE